MTTKYSTKKALISSIVVLALCFSMLIGTTFAWFTDSASSTGNVIKTGNLDVEMYYADGTEAVPTTAEGWTNVTTGGPIFNYTNWEPGYAQVRHVKIENKGSLAIKYKVLIVADGEVSDLADVIDVYYVDPAVQVETRDDLALTTKLGTLTDVLSNIGATGNGSLIAGDSDVITLALVMQESAGNEYMNKSIGTSFTVKVLATQFTSEEDSFGDQYDAEAPYQVYVDNAADLQAALNESESGAEIVLDGDITITAPITIPAAAASYSMRNVNYTVIDLNGNTINTAYAAGSTTNHVYAFTNNGNVVLKNGTINARGIYNYGNMIVENATINAIDGNGGYGVRNYAGATFTMNGGKIATTLEDDHLVNNGGYDATTLRVDSGAYAVINGGVIDNICDWTFAIDNAGEVIVNGGTIKSVHSTVSNYGTITINAGSFTCNGIEGVTAHAIVAWGGSETVINGGTFDGKDNYNGFNVDAVAGSNVVINGGNFMPVHSGSLYGEGTITVKGGTFFDEVKSDRLATGYAAANVDGKWVVSVNDLQTVINNANDGDTIVLNSDVTATSVIMVGKNITINGNGYKVSSTATRVFRLTTSNTTVTLNDVNMVSNAVRVSSNDIRGISIDAGLTNVTMTLNNCSVDFTDESAHDWAYAVNVSGNGTGNKVIVNGGTYEAANVINANGAANTIVVKDATLTSLYRPSEYPNMYGACIYVVQDYNSSVEVTGTTFNGNNAVTINAGYTPCVESNNVDNTTRA